MTIAGFILSGLYAISDGPRADLLDVCEDAIDGGARALQYRDKSRDPLRRRLEARALQALCTERGVPLIINDDVELAVAVGAAGVHLGEDDSAIADARLRLGASAIIGASCYNSLQRAGEMAAAGADYLAFGAFFASATKPRARVARRDLLREAKSLGLPVVAIGGITADNAQTLIDAGADSVAVVAAVFGAADVRVAARRFSDLFEPFPASSA